MADDPRESERRGDQDRRRYWRGGRRQADWASSAPKAPRCPRCDSPEVKFVEATPTTAFWACHRCRHQWSTGPEGRPIEE
jgi:ssDNA-binding Zn-finger/Zn-ribbon topoisomerase 1